jgi:hypothetical protein
MQITRSELDTTKDPADWFTRGRCAGSATQRSGSGVAAGVQSAGGRQRDSNVTFASGAPASRVGFGQERVGE